MAMPGFKTEVLNDISLQVDKVGHLPVTLQPGIVTESVEVSGGAPLVDTETSSLGQVIDNKKIIDLPLNGRNVWSLGLLLGGKVVPVKVSIQTCHLPAAEAVIKVTIFWARNR